MDACKWHASMLGVCNNFVAHVNKCRHFNLVLYYSWSLAATLHDQVYSAWCIVILHAACYLLGHHLGSTHLLLSSSMSCPNGHPHPSWQMSGQATSGFLQVAGQVLHCWKTWPSMGHLLACVLITVGPVLHES